MNEYKITFGGMLYVPATDADEAQNLVKETVAYAMSLIGTKINCYVYRAEERFDND